MIRSAAFATVFLAFALAAAWGQTQGRIEGRVLDPAGNSLEKVAVSIVSQRTSSIHYDISTDKGGKFIQVGLTPGNYLVTFKKDGFAPASKEVHVSIDESTRVDIQLKTVEAALQKTLSEADSLFLKGNKLLAEQKYPEACATYQEAIKLDAGNWRYYLNLGLSQKKMNQAGESLAAFKKAAELNPESPSANRETGEALARAGSLAEARPYYEKAVSLSPDDADVRFNLGLCLSGSGEPEAAFVQFEKAVELKPGSADAIYQLGLSCINLQKNERAIAAFESYLKIDPDSPRAVQVRAFLDFLKKK